MSHRNSRLFCNQRRRDNMNSKTQPMYHRHSLIIRLNIDAWWISTNISLLKEARPWYMHCQHYQGLKGGEDTNKYHWSLTVAMNKPDAQPKLSKITRKGKKLEQGSSRWLPNIVFVLKDWQEKRRLATGWQNTATVILQSQDNNIGTAHWRKFPSFF